MEIFLKEGSSLKGLLSERYLTISWVSLISLTILYLLVPLCGSLVLNLTPVSCCIDLLTSAQAGMESTQINHCVSVKPRPLVSAPAVFKVRIKHCSMIRSGEFMVGFGVAQLQELQISIFTIQGCGAKMRTAALMTLTSTSLMIECNYISS